MQNSINFEAVREWFLSYSSQFDSDDEFYQSRMVLKRNHSFRVATLCGKISAALDMDLSEQSLAKSIGLLHDTARFEQFSTYATFRDDKSVDHGNLGAEIIAGDQTLQKLLYPEMENVLQAVRLHNKASLPPLAGQMLLYCRLIRDADKLDILKIFTAKLHDSRIKTEPGENPDCGISKEIVEDIFSRRTTGYDKMKTKLDISLQKVGWVFDINFVPTLQILVEKGYLKEFQQALPATEEMDGLFNYVYEYIDSRVNA